ncbi:MAG: type III PLP-dependent enzyme [Symploca sp. SIO1A3]|nr:type III PLP-dependent enzyme [Symploca sp. SIO1A3]
MDQVQNLVSQYFGTSNRELHLGGIPVGNIAAEYGTPLFVYDSQVLDQKWNLLRKALPPEFAISYSVKANPNPAILKFFLDRGGGLEIASAGEFHRALSVGCPPEQILFAGPGKTPAELELVLSKGIGEIHIESLLEAQRISAISSQLGVPAKVAVRVNPTGDAQGGAMRMGGKPLPFGVDEETLDDVLDQILPDKFLDFQGLHLFTGTQILDYEILVDQYRKGLEIAKRVAQRLGHPLNTIDFGGGLGILYFAQDQELNMEKLREELAVLMTQIKNEPLLAGTKLMVEPGRYLVGEGGVYVTRINDIKVSRGKKFLIVDGGMHHHLAASGNLGQTIKRNYPVALLNKLTDTPEETVDVVGPLCTPLDVLARRITLPQAEVGDLVGVFQSGGYARSASPLGFLSHATPPEVWVERGQAYLISERGS